MEDNQPSVIIVRDDEGRVHHTSPYSEIAKKYANREEAPSEAESLATGDDRDPGTDDSGSGERKRATRSSGGAARSAGEAESGAGS